MSAKHSLKSIGSLNCKHCCRQQNRQKQSRSPEIRLGNLTEPEAEVTVVPVATGEEEEYLIVIHDVSKERQLERIRADFVANVSHELRTPLTTIRGYAETLLGEDATRTKAQEQFVVKSSIMLPGSQD